MARGRGQEWRRGQIWARLGLYAAEFPKLGHLQQTPSLGSHFLVCPTRSLEPIFWVSRGWKASQVLNQQPFLLFFVLFVFIP